MTSPRGKVSPLVFFSVIALLGAAAPTGATPKVGYPVIAAAGDIACDPFDGSYDGGRGTSSAYEHMSSNARCIWPSQRMT